MNRFDIVVTRFDNITWQEHTRWMNRTDFHGCIYSSEFGMAQTIRHKQPLFVLEMNNSTNRIQGFGIIRNQPSMKKYNKYANQYYSRYQYVGTHRIDVSTATPHEQQFIWILEHLIFHGRGHIKRGCGISRFPPRWVLNRTICIKSCIAEMFFTRDIMCEFTKPSPRPRPRLVRATTQRPVSHTKIVSCGKISPLPTI